MDEALPKDIPKTAASSIVHAQGLGVNRSTYEHAQFERACT